MTQFPDCTAPRPFLHALRHFLTPDVLGHALAFSGRRFRHRDWPAPVVLLLLVAGFVHGKRGLPRVRDWLGFGRTATDGSDQALDQARQRLGWRPLWWLRRHALDWLAHATADPTAFYRGHRPIAVDGTTLAVADTPANTRVFGKSRNQHETGGFPRVRIAAPCEVGTRALVRGIARPYRVPEQRLLSRLLRFVPAGALLLADRNFHDWKLWDAARRRGFSLLLRVQSGPRFPVLERFADGSYRSEIHPRRGPNKKGRAIAVRVLTCQITVGTRTATDRPLTNLLDPASAPARELVDLYAKRWEIESAFAEFKGQLADRTTALRSHHPRAAMAELDALLIGYFAVRRIALRAARLEKVDPLSISFCRAVPAVAWFVVHPRMSERAFLCVVAQRRNVRRRRVCRRCRKVVRCAWPVKSPDDRATPYTKVTVTIQEPNGLS